MDSQVSSLTSTPLAMESDLGAAALHPFDILELVRCAPRPGQCRRVSMRPPRALTMDERLRMSRPCPLDNDAGPTFPEGACPIQA